MTRISRMVSALLAVSLTVLGSPVDSAGSDPGHIRRSHSQDGRSQPADLPDSRGSRSSRPGFVDREAATTESSVDEAIVRCVETDMQTIESPGAAVTVVLDGEVIFSRGFGVKRLGGPNPVNADTRFRIGSITKMLTAASVMRWVDVGLVDLDAPVTEWIPELTFAGRWSAESVTVRHLLTHSSAVPDHYENPFYPVGDDALAEWAGSLDEFSLLAPPGTFWNYSNPGIDLAGLVAERAGGLPFRELLEATVFEPADMTSTTFDPATVIAEGNYAFGHDPQPFGPPAVYGPDSYDSWLASPSGLAFSTAPDLAQWALLLMDGGGAVLSPSSSSAMQERQIYLDHVPDLHYGFGVFAEKYKGLDVRQHGGNVFGWGAFLLWVPERRFVVSILANTTFSLNAAAYCIVDEVLEPDSTPPVDYSTDPSTWRRYTGFYRLTADEGHNFDAWVTKDDDRFFITIFEPGGSDALFSAELVQVYLDTFRVESGEFGFFEPDLSVDPTVTFIHRVVNGGSKMWLRNRGIVGERMRLPRLPQGRAGFD